MYYINYIIEEILSRFILVQYSVQKYSDLEETKTFLNKNQFNLPKEKKKIQSYQMTA